MTQVGSVYGEALYSLARDESLNEIILEQLNVLSSSFRQEPDFIQLLGTPDLPKAERCQILDNCFRGRLQPYVLNFLKLLAEKGYIRHFERCVQRYRELYNRDKGILPVTAVTAVAMSEAQTGKLAEKLRNITGKRIELTNKLDPAILGGIRLDYDGKRMDDTLSHRLEAVRNRLKSTAL